MWSSIFVNQWPVARRDDYDIAGLQLTRNPVENFSAVIAGAIELDDCALGGRTALTVGDFGTQHQRARAGNDVVHLAHLVVLGDRILVWLVELAAIDHADADVRLAAGDVPDLPVDQLLGA